MMWFTKDTYGANLTSLGSCHSNEIPRCFKLETASSTAVVCQASKRACSLDQKSSVTSLKWLLQSIDFGQEASSDCMNYVTAVLVLLVLVLREDNLQFVSTHICKLVSSHKLVQMGCILQDLFTKVNILLQKNNAVTHWTQQFIF